MSTTSSAISSPPSTGNAIAEMISPPTPVANSIGASAMIATPSVSSFGRSRWTAPSITAWRSSSSDLMFSSPPRLSMASRR